MKKILRLQTTNFRNLSSQVIHFGPGINCLFGGNGNGKTNVLEAIYVLGKKKSFRKNTSFPQMLSLDCEKPEIILKSVFLNKEIGEEYISGMWQENKIEWPKKSNLATLFIGPFDSFQFHQSSAQRREFFDHTFSMISPRYEKVLKNYGRSLQQRNALLSKRGRYDLQNQVMAIDENMAIYASELHFLRVKYLEEFNPIAKMIFHHLFHEQHEIEIKTDFSLNLFNPSVENIRKTWENNFQEDSQRGHTTKGPHRDDFIPYFDGFNALEFCSLGQQKALYFGLVFAFIELFKIEHKFYPILMMDDVSGELDQQRWERLVHFLHKQEFQVLITTANEGFRHELDRIGGITNLRVENGNIATS